MKFPLVVTLLVPVCALAAIAACDNNTDPRWQLHHDRIIAVRMSPPHLLAGQVATIDGFVTSIDDGPAVAMPTMAALEPGGPASIASSIVANNGGTWQITAPSDADLATARTSLGLAAGAPVPIEIVTTFSVGGETLVALKAITFGDTGDNPTLGAVTVDGVAPSDDPSAVINVPYDADVQLAITQDSNDSVNWFTSVGSLNSDDNEHMALLHVNATDRTTGYFAVVVRDKSGGVVWNNWSMATPTAPVQVP